MENRELIFSERVTPLRKYEVRRPEEEKIEEWVVGVNEVYEVLVSGDLKKMKELMVGGNYKASVRKVLEIQDVEHLNEDQKKLLAINLWVYREQNAWRGKGWREKLPYLWRFVKGGEVDMNMFVEKEWVPNCIDSALLVHVLANKMGVSGNVRKISKHHRSWQSDEGDVVDIWYGYRRGGLYTSEEEYQTRVREKQHGKNNEEEKHSCGSRWAGESDGFDFEEDI